MAGAASPKGLLVAGNIDLYHRPVVHNADGSTSTVRSMSFEENGREILVPTVVGNKVVSEKEAIAEYHRTGKHLGIFDSAANASAYGRQLHEEYAKGKYMPVTNPRQQQANATLRSLLADPETPEGTKAHIRTQLAASGEPTDVTAESVRRFGREQSAPAETPKEAIRRATTEGVAAARPKSPFALPEGAVINESAQGVGLWERLLLKNLAANPAAAARWLRMKGYETYLYEPTEAGTQPTAMGGMLPASKMRIAVRRPGETDFKVVDPANFDLQDITDLFGDLIFGAVAQAGMSAGLKLGALAGAGGGPWGVATGGAAGAMTGGAAAGAVGEVGRQKLGQGVSALFSQPPLNPELSTPEVGAQAIGGAMAFPVTKALGAAGRGLSRAVGAVGEGAKRIALGTIGYMAKLTPEQLATAIANRAVILQPLDLFGAPKVASELAQKTMQFLTGLDESKTLEYQIGQNLLGQYGTGTVRLKPILEAIRTEVLSPFKEVTATPKFMGLPTGPSVTTKVAQQAGRYGLEAAENDKIRSMLVEEAGKLAKNAGLDSIEEAIAKDATIPTAAAESLKRLYAEQANYAATALEKDAAKEAANGFLADRLREGTRESITDPVIREQYVKMMDTAGRKLGLAKQLQKALIAKGAEEITPEAAIGAAIPEDEIIQAANRPEQFFRTYLGKGARSGQKGLVREFGRLWGPELEMAGLGSFEEQARLASTLSALGAEDSATFGGRPGVNVTAPHLSFGGKPLGVSLGAMVGGAGGYLAGGVPGAEAGAISGGLLGGYAATPRGSIRTASAAKALMEGATKVGQFLPDVAAGERLRLTVPFSGGIEVPIAPTAAGIVAGRTVGAEKPALERDQEATRRLVASDAQAMAALSKIAAEVRADMTKNPNLTQDDAVAEFVRRKDAWLKQRGMTVAGSAAQPATTP